MFALTVIKLRNIQIIHTTFHAITADFQPIYYLKRWNRNWLISLSLMQMSVARKVIYGVWVGLVIFLLTLFVISPSSFTPEAIVLFLRNYQAQLLVAFCTVSILRGLVLIPSTPFVLAGALLFPEQPWLVIGVSMLGVIIGSTAIYYFSDFLGFSEKLEQKFPKQLAIWQRRLNSSRATLIVIAWSFFPLVPTDIICYAAGIVKMPYRYLILGVILGEFVLISLYVYFGGDLLAYLF